MTNCHLSPITLPSLTVQEAREKRRKVLEAVRQRRRIIYTRFHQKNAGAKPSYAVNHQMCEAINNTIIP